MLPQARLIVIAGLPGSGKTTLARKLERELPALRLSADDWMDGLGMNLHAEQDRSRVEKLQWQLAQQLLALGNTVIIEWGTWGKWERDILRERARALGAAVELHYLSAPLDELFRRIELRAIEDPPIRWEAVQEWGSNIEPPTDEEFARFDPPLLRAKEKPASPQDRQLHIRAFRSEDRAELQAIRERAFAPVFASWRELLGKEIFSRQYPDADRKQAEYLDSLMEPKEGTELHVLEHNGRVAGFLGLSIDREGGGGEIELNAVDPSLQTRGLGSALHRFAVERLRERGATMARVGTALDDSHASARKAYAKAGFSVGLPYVALFQMLPHNAYQKASGGTRMMEDTATNIEELRED